mgnify:CR=1 FL=1
MSLNSVNLIGRLTKDVELKTVGEGIKKGTFTLAVSRSYVSKGEEKPKCDFIPVVVWRGTADFAAKYFSKGMQVYVSGSIETYQTEKDGEKRNGFQINAKEVGFADSKHPSNNSGNTATGGDLPFDLPAPSDFADDDLPF